MTDVTVLGAGPAGLAAALELAESGVNVTVLEKQHHVGGNATSFDFGGINVDYGSHRLHPASPPQVLERIRGLLGDDLLTRPRHGRIRLMGRWIHFPLRPVDLLLRMHPRFATGVGLDLARKALSAGSSKTGDETFASILEKGLGRTICREFYFPYARKIWGIAPERISPIQAYKRVSAGSIGKMLRRLLPGSSKGGASTKGIFYYPRNGFGQICTALYEAAARAGADVRLGATVNEIRLSGGPERQVVFEHGGTSHSVTTNQVYSTIPVTLLPRLLDMPVPEEVRAAGESLRFRSMVLVYLLLAQDRFTEYDAHYFPGEEFPFTRISETKNYTDRDEPRGRTSLCAEIPCFRDDAIWTMPEQELAGQVSTGLARAGLPVNAEILEVRVERIAHAYPLFTTGYEEHFGRLDAWLDRIDGLLSFGRQGLYVHDNTHHAIYMAQAAVNCLRADGSIDTAAWHEQRKVFEKHVVED